MKLALVLNVVDPSIGGVLIMGHRGTGKSTAVRALAQLLPDITVVKNCIYRCDPKKPESLCDTCAASVNPAAFETEQVPVRVVELPLGATEDRVCGTIDIERALLTGTRAFEAGLLARANRGFLYIDEANLLDDHLVDLLLDAAASGRNRVERENISVEHPARFVLIGSGNPEEGELRPQIQDRFGCYVEVTTDNNPEARAAVVENRQLFERDTEAFLEQNKANQDRLRRQIIEAQNRLDEIQMDRSLLVQIAQLCSVLEIDGHRGELTIARASQALTALEGRTRVTEDEVRRVAAMCLRHRLRREALEETSSSRRITEALDHVFASGLDNITGSGDDDDSSGQSQVRSSRSESTFAGKVSRAVTANKKEVASRKADAENRGITKLADPAESPSTIPEFVSTSRKRLFSSSNARHRARRGTNATSRAQKSTHGRYRQAVSYKTARVAFDATLRALANEWVSHNGKNRAKPTLVPREALRYKVLSRKNGRLFIFAIDTSGSMALNRISLAKGALLPLLRKSYLNRDRVAIVGFSGSEARVCLPPTRSVLRARRVLDSLRVGGRTSLSAGIACSLELARQVARQGSSETAILVFTDGRANVSMRKPQAADSNQRKRLIDEEMKLLGCELQHAGVTTVLVETQNRFASGHEARNIASLLGAELLQISSQSFTHVKIKSP